METIFFNTILFSSLLLIIFLYQILKTNNKTYANATHPPTPPSLPILGHLHLFTKPLHRKLADLAGHLGPVISLRFGSRPIVVISSPELAELCLTAHAAPIHRTDLLFSHCSRSAASIHADECRRLLRGIFREAEAAAAEWSVGGAVKVEMNSRLFGMGVDVVMRMVGGKRYYGEGGVEGEGGRRVREAVEELFGRRRASNVGDLMPWLRWVDAVEVGRRLPRFRDRMDELLQELNGDEEEEDGERTLIRILQSLKIADPDNYDDCFIKNIVMVSKPSLSIDH